MKDKFHRRIKSTVNLADLNESTSSIIVKGECTCDFALKGLFCCHQWVCIVLAFQRYQIELKRWTAPPLPQELKQAIPENLFDQFFKNVERKVKCLEEELKPLKSEKDSEGTLIASKEYSISMAQTHYPDYARDMWYENLDAKRRLNALSNHVRKIEMQLYEAGKILSLRQLGTRGMTRGPVLTEEERNELKRRPDEPNWDLPDDDDGWWEEFGDDEEAIREAKERIRGKKQV